MSTTSDTSESDLEALQQLSDWDTDTDSDSTQNSDNRGRVNYMLELGGSEFTYRFRISKCAVTNLLTEVYPYLKTTSRRNYGIEPINQLLLTLRFYALGTMLESVAEYVGVSVSSASRIIGDVSHAIAQLYDNHIKIDDPTPAEFKQIAGFPGVHGVIGCIHVPIQYRDSEVGEEFRNTNGTHSLKVQAVCNAKLLFLNVLCQSPGSMHDARIFDNSNLRSQCESGILNNRWLLGDSAYPCRSYLLTPVRNPNTRNEELYNAAHIKTHSTIKRCFGVWKRRFPVISNKIRLSLSKVQTIITATAILHNICRKDNIPEVEPEVEIVDQSWEPVCSPQTLTHCQERFDLINDYFGRIED